LTDGTPVQAREPWLFHQGWPVSAIAASKLLLHLWTSRSYGYFVDELYYLACANHMSWGYVDQPPLIAFIARYERAVLGDSLPAIRLLPVVAGVAKVLLTGLIARELGGRRMAQTIAALCIFAAPGFLAMDNWLSMNAFEPLFWMGCAWLLIRLIKGGRPTLWIWFGLVAGLGLENKYSMLIFGFGLIAGLALTPERRLLRTLWLWAGGALAFLLVAPNLAWNIRYHFPFLELQANIRASGRDVPLPPWTFFAEETLAMLPLTLPIWMAGLWFFFRHRGGRPFRALGWAWLLTAVVIMALNPRIYYLFPAFSLLFAGGGVMWEEWLEGLALARRRWIAWTHAGITVALAAVTAPLVVPLLPVEAYIRYAHAIHFQQPRI
jgi:4-amino-4-deoxy-L-arabinose transferase-like glycosyltransferase